MRALLAVLRAHPHLEKTDRYDAGEAIRATEVTLRQMKVSERLSAN